MIYLASPYSSSDLVIQLERADLIARLCAKLLTKKYQVFSPIAFGQLMLDYEPELPTDAKYWEKYNAFFLKNCTEMWIILIQGWEKSLGVQAEIAFAKANNIKIKYVSVEDIL